MFILRTVFWLSLVVLILPTDAQQQQELGRKARAAVYQVTTFCDRNPKSCETGYRYWQIFKEKADYGMQLAINLILERSEDSNAPSNWSRSRTNMQSSRDTLRQSDLVPPWRPPYSNQDL